MIDRCVVLSQRAPHGFRVNMKLEAVDRRNPMLIRVATITDTEDYRVKVLCVCLFVCVCVFACVF